MAISKNQLKTITGLSQKKYRQKHQLFIAEGVKVIRELLILDVFFWWLVTENHFLDQISSDTQRSIKYPFQSDLLF